MAIIHDQTPRNVDGKLQIMSLEEFKEWLKKFDSNGDGRISKEELRQAIRAKGGWFTRWKCKDGLKSADKDGNGFIEDDEMSYLKDFALKHLDQDKPRDFKGKHQIMTSEEFKKWLKKFDSNKDGRISKEELREAMRAKGVWFTRWKYKSGMKAADKNRNGFIEDDEMIYLKDFALKHLGIKIVTS
ncbi:uncharacterized protein [Coffea arabica]|uniref:EF-hand domain-containing protein n=1 Tax=Coffea arabica TaxID=13443 RepID=A0A6P6UMW3_COFAR|nr:calmodulin-like protein 12 [Coffea arabica]